MALSLEQLMNPQQTLVMGVLNITQDSFSDGGLWLDPDKAIEHAQDMIAAGADIIDIGAESTRPGAIRVDEQEELQRVVRAVKPLAEQGAIISVDTTRASVAQAALDAGASIINDVSGGLLDPQIAHVVAQYECVYILQHWRGWLQGGTSRVPDADTAHYEHGVLADVMGELREQIDAVCEAGVDSDHIVIDPGLGFSKPTIELNMPLMTGLHNLQTLGFPVLIGASRKRFTAALAGECGFEATNEQRDYVTATLSALCSLHGAWAVRVHNVAASKLAIATAQAWKQYQNN